jgi:hypothetical protein
MKKIKKLKLRYLLPLLVVILFLVGWGLESIEVIREQTCGGQSFFVFKLCLGIGFSFMALTVLPGYYLVNIFEESILRSNMSDEIVYSLFGIVSLLVYFMFGYLFEKIIRRNN